MDRKHLDQNYNEALRQISENRGTMTEGRRNELTLFVLERELSKLRKSHENESWLSPLKTEREWQEKHIKKIFPSYPNSSPNWQTLNGLIRFSCENLDICIDDPNISPLEK